jgi:hypothetical protein
MVAILFAHQAPHKSFVSLCCRPSHVAASSGGQPCCHTVAVCLFRLTHAYGILLVSLEEHASCIDLPGVPLEGCELGASQIGVPSQHSEAPTRLQQQVLRTNFDVRCKLAQKFPAVFAPPAARLLSVPKRSSRHNRPEHLYRDALHAANRTTMLLCAMSVVPVAVGVVSVLSFGYSCRL